MQSKRRPELDIVLEADEANVREARQSLGPVVDLLQDLIGLHELLGQLAFESGIQPADAVAIAPALLVNCRYHLMMGAIAALKGHFTDSYAHSRNALESCGIACRIKRRPEAATVWLGALLADRSKARREFTTRNLFPEDDIKLKRLGELFDFASVMTHASLHSIAGRLKTSLSDGRLEFVFAYNEFREGDTSQPITCYLRTIQTHLLILELFGGVFDEAVSFGAGRWSTEFEYVANKFHRFLTLWAPAIKSWRDVLLATEAEKDGAPPRTE